MPQPSPMMPTPKQPMTLPSRPETKEERKAREKAEKKERERLEKEKKEQEKREKKERKEREKLEKKDKRKSSKFWPVPNWRRRVILKLLSNAACYCLFYPIKCEIIRRKAAHLPLEKFTVLSPDSSCFALLRKAKIAPFQRYGYRWRLSLYCFFSWVGHILLMRVYSSEFQMEFTLFSDPWLSVLPKMRRVKPWDVSWSGRWGLTVNSGG